MKKILILALIFIAAKSYSQVAKSFHYSGSAPTRSGTYVEKHPTEDSYFIAMQRSYSGQSKTILTKLDNAGNTLWYSSPISQVGTNTFFNSLGDLVIHNDSIYISVYDFPTIATATLNIYKFDLDGVLHDSIIIPGNLGLKRFRSDMIVNGQGELVTGLKGNDNQVQFCRINPTTMTLVDMEPIVTSSFANTQAERSMFFEFDGSNTHVVFNAQDSIYYAIINSTGAITANDFILSPDGEVMDTEVAAGNLTLLVNDAFTVITPASNPIRILVVNNTFDIVSNTTYVGTYPLVYTSFAIDSDGAYFICGRKSGGVTTNAESALIKIAAGTIQYEHNIAYSNLTEIQISNANLIAAGNHRDWVNDCSSDANANVIILYKKNTIPTFEVVTTHMDLIVNNITAQISYSSNNFTDVASGTASYTIEGAGGTIYSSSLLINGENISSQLKSSCLSFENAYAAGPVTNQTDYNQLERDKWERVWKISRAEIDAHIQAHQTGDVSYVTPEVILNWPGNGDPAKGQSQKVARFQDLNNNSIYEPLQGEYPLIKGDICILSIYNDANADTAYVCFGPSDRMNIEVHEYAYGFECQQDSALQNTLFVYYEIIHKSSQTIYNSYVGNFIDHDIQNASDDFISSDPMRGIFYARNGDGSGPEQAYLILGSTSDDDGLDNASGINAGESPNGYGYEDMLIDNERLGMTNFVYYYNSVGPSGDPTTAIHFYNYMQSIWQNGAHVLYGGNGYDVGTTLTETNFMFPGDSDNALWYSTNGVDPGADWSEEIAGNANGDRRGIASSGPFLYLPYDTLFFDVAHVTGMENTFGGYTGHQAMINHVDSVRSFFALDSLPCGQDFDFYAPFDGIYPYIGITETEKISPVLYPNPTSGNLTITGLPANAQISVYNLTGQLITDVLVKTNAVNFDYTELPRGIYFVNVQSESYSGTTKFVKQ